MQLPELLQLRHIVRRKAARWCCCLWWRWSRLLVDWRSCLLLRILLLLHIIDLRVLLGICLLLLRRFRGPVMARCIGCSSYHSSPYNCSSSHSPSHEHRSSPCRATTRVAPTILEHFLYYSVDLTADFTCPAFCFAASSSCSSSCSTSGGTNPPTTVMPPAFLMASFKPMAQVCSNRSMLAELLLGMLAAACCISAGESRLMRLLASGPNSAVSSLLSSLTSSAVTLP